MRDILFRGKRKDNGEWVEGYYNYATDGYNLELHLISDKITGIHTEVIPETVGQYTGLKDKNGKKIFEGDIVKISLYEIFREQVIAIVAWDIRKAVFYLYGKTVITDFYHYFGDECEVIGNIYDNPIVSKKGR